eukprot:m.349649 g.349649  ORF g.349649 m.349649 type:complete len:63 (-) comp43137_c0_seq1:170-358(-)
MLTLNHIMLTVRESVLLSVMQTTNTPIQIILTLIMDMDMDMDIFIELFCYVIWNYVNFPYRI